MPFNPYGSGGLPGRMPGASGGLPFGADRAAANASRVQSVMGGPAPAPGYKRGGRVSDDSGTHINITVGAPTKPDPAAALAGLAAGMPKPPPPPMAGPPSAGPPPGLIGGPKPMGGMPGVGGPAMQRGGRVKMDAGAGGGKGRLEKIKK